jgi:hypothetical protein
MCWRASLSVSTGRIQRAQSHRRSDRQQLKKFNAEIAWFDHYVIGTEFTAEISHLDAPNALPRP